MKKKQKRTKASKIKNKKYSINKKNKVYIINRKLYIFLVVPGPLIAETCSTGTLLASNLLMILYRFIIIIVVNFLLIYIYYIMPSVSGNLKTKHIILQNNAGGVDYSMGISKSDEFELKRGTEVLFSVEPDVEAVLGEGTEEGSKLTVAKDTEFSGDVNVVGNLQASNLKPEGQPYLPEFKVCRNGLWYSKEMTPAVYVPEPEGSYAGGLNVDYYNERTNEESTRYYCDIFMRLLLETDDDAAEEFYRSGSFPTLNPDGKTPLATSEAGRCAIWHMQRLFAAETLANSNTTNIEQDQVKMRSDHMTCGVVPGIGDSIVCSIMKILGCGFPMQVFPSGLSHLDAKLSDIRADPSGSGVPSKTNEDGTFSHLGATGNNNIGFTSIPTVPGQNENITINRMLELTMDAFGNPEFSTNKAGYPRPYLVHNLPRLEDLCARPNGLGFTSEEIVLEQTFFDRTYSDMNSCDCDVVVDIYGNPDEYKLLREGADNLNKFEVVDMSQMLESRWHKSLNACETILCAASVMDWEFSRYDPVVGPLYKLVPYNPNRNRTKQFPVKFVNGQKTDLSDDYASAVHGPGLTRNNLTETHTAEEAGQPGIGNKVYDAEKATAHGLFTFAGADTSTMTTLQLEHLLFGSGGACCHLISHGVANRSEYFRAVLECNDYQKTQNFINPTPLTYAISTHPDWPKWEDPNRPGLRGCYWYHIYGITFIGGVLTMMSNGTIETSTERYSHLWIKTCIDVMKRDKRFLTKSLKSFAGCLKLLPENQGKTVDLSKYI